jgi:hypothetical protein
MRNTFMTSIAAVALLGACSPAKESTVPLAEGDYSIAHELTKIAPITLTPDTSFLSTEERQVVNLLIEAADLVSDIRPLKHPFKDQGVKAQAGVEF